MNEKNITIHFYTGRLAGFDSWGIWVVMYEWNEKRDKIINEFILRNNEWIKKKEGELVDATIKATAPYRDAMIEGMQKYVNSQGLAYKENTDKELEAIKNHLQDMRTLVFKIS